MVQSVQKESAPLASNALSPSNASAKFSNMGMGIEEDSATVAACAGLVGAMASKQDFGGTAYRLSIQQGVSMGRPSEIEAEARKSGSVVPLSALVSPWPTLQAVRSRCRRPRWCLRSSRALLCV